MFFDCQAVCNIVFIGSAIIDGVVNSALNQKV